MNTKYVIFFLDMEKHKDNKDEEKFLQFPEGWGHIEPAGYPYSGENKDRSLMLFETEHEAILWLRGNMLSQHIYKIAKWTLKENIKVFSNCPTLVEVDEV